MSAQRLVPPSICWHCGRAIYWRSERWVHVTGRTHCYSPNGDRNDAVPRPAPCTVCHRGFSLDEWVNRHTDPDDATSDVHAECCRWCVTDGTSHDDRTGTTTHDHA